MESARSRRLIVAAAVAGLLFRLAFAFFYWHDKPLTHDEREYLELAAGLASGHGFTYADAPAAGTAPRFGRAPGYPLFLALIGAGRTGETSTPARVKIAQAFVGAIAVWLIGMLAARAGGPTAGAIGAAIASVYPPLVWIGAYVLSEALYSTVALTAVLLLDRALDAHDSLRRDAVGAGRRHALAALAGLATGAAILIRPATLFFVPLALLWLLSSRRLAIAVAVAAGTILIVAPWTIRNLRVYDRFVLVASEGGVTFWTGNHPLARGEGDLAANPLIKAAEIEFRAAHPGASAEELEPLYYREAFRFIAAHPGRWLMLLGRKAIYTIVPAGPSYTLHSTLYRIASIASYLLVLPFAAAGMRTWWRGPRPPEALFLLAASAVLVCLLFFPQERFRIPVIDPTLIVCAAVWGGSRLRHHEV